MDSRLIPAHLKRVQEQIKLQTSHNVEVDGLASHLFALTFTDDGPDPKSSVNKLWNSRADYQESGPSSDVIAGSLDPLPFSDIAESLSRLSINSATSASPPNSHPASQVAGRRVSKKDGYQRSVKALKLLSNIETRAGRCLRLLLEPSNNSIVEITNELASLRRALETINQRTDFVDSRKKEVTALLDQLESEVKTKSSSFPSSNDSEPVNIDTGRRIFI